MDAIRCHYLPLFIMSSYHSFTVIVGILGYPRPKTSFCTLSRAIMYGVGANRLTINPSRIKQLFNGHNFHSKCLHFFTACFPIQYFSHHYSQKRLMSLSILWYNTIKWKKRLSVSDYIIIWSSKHDIRYLTLNS